MNEAFKTPIGAPIGAPIRNNSPQIFDQGAIISCLIKTQQLERKRGFEPPTLSLAITLTDPLACKWIHPYEAKNA